MHRAIDIAEDRKIPVIFAGDFNSKSEHAAYNVATGEAKETTVEKARTETCADYIESYWHEHTLKLRAAYEGRQEPYTNLAVEGGRMFQWLLDHIFYSNDLEVVEIYQNESIFKTTKTGVMPNLFYPSDHLPLAAGFLY
jgi:endonuclease/exonuclease/phosphatase (EEP) superfamily protein YafD